VLGTPISAPCISNGQIYIEFSFSPSFPTIEISRYWHPIYHIVLGVRKALLTFCADFHIDNPAHKDFIPAFKFLKYFSLFISVRTAIHWHIACFFKRNVLRFNRLAMHNCFINLILRGIGCNPSVRLLLSLTY